MHFWFYPVATNIDNLDELEPHMHAFSKKEENGC